MSDKYSLKYGSLLIFLLACPVFLLITSAYTLASNYPLPDFTPEEQNWVDNHPIVRLAPDPDFPPIEYLDDNGAYAGIAADFVYLLEKKLPLKFEIVILENWSEVLNQARNRNIDMFGAAVPTPERLQYMTFSRPYAEFPAVVLVRSSADHFPTLSELKGKRVAVVADYGEHDYMVRNYPQIPLDVVPDISSGLRQLAFGKVDAMVLNLASASFYIQKNGITNLKVTEDTDFVFDMSFASRNDWPELASIIEKGMQAISPAEKREILNKWISLKEKPWRIPPLVLYSSLLAVLILILVAIINWNRTLQREVRERTADLENELAERILAEQEKEQLQQQIHRAKKMEALGLLAGGVAHDLNNILSGAVGYSDLIMRKLSDDDPLLNHLKEIRESGRRAAEVVADLLTISRDAASDRQIANLNDIVAEYIASPEHQSLLTQYPDLTFHLELDRDLLNLFCSVTHLKKSLMNLIINAAEATQKGDITVKTSQRTIVGPDKDHEDIKPGRFVTLAICDSGPGIAAEDLEHIFDPFYSKKKLGRSGTGLGLTVVWNTVQEHQGFIDVLQLETGSCFELNFPATERTQPDASLLLNDEDILGHGEHILVIDDELEIRVLAEHLLCNLGYKVSVAASGEEGLAFLRENRVDLVVLDMLMEPGMNGYQTYQQIKTVLPEQKAIIASGFSADKDVRLTQALGAGTYIKKPYTIEELGIAVKRELQALK